MDFCGGEWTKRDAGSAPARIDDKGRLKVPTLFRGGIEDHQGPRRLCYQPHGRIRTHLSHVGLARDRTPVLSSASNHPSRLRFLDRVNYFGQTSELDSQGRGDPPQLRESASIVGEVRVFGRIDYLEVWNEDGSSSCIVTRDRRTRPRLAEYRNLICSAR